MTVPPRFFRPPPKVNSGLIKLRRIEEDRDVNTEKYVKLLKRLFADRRKMLRRKIDDEILRKCGIDPQARAERDPYAPIRHCYPIDDVLYSKKSEYQEILVVKSPHFGKMLILDGVVQVDEKYEHLYHEMLVHVPMFSHPCPEDVLNPFFRF